MWRKGFLLRNGALLGKGCSAQFLCGANGNSNNNNGGMYFGSIVVRRAHSPIFKLNQLKENGEVDNSEKIEELSSEKLPDFDSLPKPVQEYLMKISENPEQQRVSFAMRAMHSILKQYENNLSVLTPSFYNIIAFNVARKHKHLKSTIKLIELFEDLGVMSPLLHRYAIICMTDSSNIGQTPLGEVWKFLFKYDFTPHPESFRKFLIALIDHGMEDSSFDKIIFEMDPEASQKYGNKLPVHVKIRFVLIHMVKYDISLTWKHYRPLVLALIRENQKDLITTFFETLYSNNRVYENSEYSPFEAISASSVPGFSHLNIEKDGKPYHQPLWPLRKTGKIQLISLFVKECSASKLSDVAQYIFKKTTKYVSVDTKSINAILNTMIESNDIHVFDLYNEFKRAYSPLINIATITIMLKGYTKFIGLTTDSSLQVLLYKQGSELQQQVQDLKIHTDKSYFKNVMWFYHACNSFIDVDMNNVENLLRFMRKCGIRADDDFTVYIMMALSNSPDGISFFKKYASKANPIDVNILNWALKTSLNTECFEDSVDILSYLGSERDSYVVCYNEETFKICFNIWKKLILVGKPDEFPIHKVLQDMEKCFANNTLEPTEDLLSFLGSVLLKFYESKNIVGEDLLKNTMTVITKYYPSELIVTKPKLVSLALSSVIGKGSVDINLLEKTVTMLETYDENFFDTIHYTQLLRIINKSNTPNRWKLMRIILQKMTNTKKHPNLVTLQTIVEIILKEMPHMYTLLLQILSIMKNRLIFDSEATEVHVRSKQQLSLWLEEVTDLISKVRDQETALAEKQMEAKSNSSEDLQT
ncbi:predicted protein [Naegleria gruberi]|uniref:Predicted protein n=1 Tax=Naegleria gruberi TaxID=5762 RepID=D2VAV0_NAEGR|nr:uncharacterized protein NAEGRDRAFT_48050 [Naegleria gruberi]EFC46012.1 predicted protein [Naegleria gruberi]|eukprot:XP_002678756.1 predicted protein [Naegleria gruberi strain NEG-M]